MECALHTEPCARERSERSDDPNGPNAITVPRSRDGNRHTLALQIDKERAAVGRKRRAGKVRMIHGVSCQPVELAGRRDAHDEFFTGTILAKDQVSPWRDGDVVAILDEGPVVRFNEELETSRRVPFVRGAFGRAREVAPDLPRFLPASVRAGKVPPHLVRTTCLRHGQNGRHPFRIPDTGDHQKASRLIQLDPPGLEHGAGLHALLVPVAGIEASPVFHAEYLETTTLSNSARFLWNESIDEPVTAVLGQIDDA